MLQLETGIRVHVIIKRTGIPVKMNYPATLVELNYSPANPPATTVRLRPKNAKRERFLGDIEFLAIYEGWGNSAVGEALKTGDYSQAAFMQETRLCDRPRPYSGLIVGRSRGLMKEWLLRKLQAARIYARSEPGGVSVAPEDHIEATELWLKESNRNPNDEWFADH